jgi:hypothetical protein
MIPKCERSDAKDRVRHKICKDKLTDSREQYCRTHREKHSTYKEWYCLWFQSSTGGLGRYTMQTREDCCIHTHTCVYFTSHIVFHRTRVPLPGDSEIFHQQPYLLIYNNSKSQATKGMFFYGKGLNLESIPTEIKARRRYSEKKSFG